MNEEEFIIDLNFLENNKILNDYRNEENKNKIYSSLIKFLLKIIKYGNKILESLSGDNEEFKIIFENLLIKEHEIEKFKKFLNNILEFNFDKGKFNSYINSFFLKIHQIYFICDELKYLYFLKESKKKKLWIILKSYFNLYVNFYYYFPDEYEIYKVNSKNNQQFIYEFEDNLWDFVKKYLSNEHKKLNLEKIPAEKSNLKIVFGKPIMEIIEKNDKSILNEDDKQKNNIKKEIINIFEDFNSEFKQFKNKENDEYDYDPEININKFEENIKFNKLEYKNSDKVKIMILNKKIKKEKSITKISKWWKKIKKNFNSNFELNKKYKVKINLNKIKKKDILKFDLETSESENNSDILKFEKEIINNKIENDNLKIKNNKIKDGKIQILKMTTNNGYLKKNDIDEFSQNNEELLNNKVDLTNVKCYNFDYIKTDYLIILKISLFSDEIIPLENFLKIKTSNDSEIITEFNLLNSKFDQRILIQDILETKNNINCKFIKNKLNLIKIKEKIFNNFKNENLKFNYENCYQYFTENYIFDKKKIINYNIIITAKDLNRIKISLIN